MDHLMLACLVLHTGAQDAARDDGPTEEQDVWWLARAEEAL
ncbi:hypothetical protein [Mumia sp. DW29H23]